MKLHHVGFIVKDIDSWEKNVIYQKKLFDVFDHLQNARLALYTNYSNVFIELIQPMNDNSYTWNSLKKNGNHFNHFCYEGRQIYFYYTKNEQVVEFLINKLS